MVSRLADDVLASIGNSSPIRLRACLRAAITLDRRFGIETLFGAIRDGNLTIMSAILAETAEEDPCDLFDHMQVQPLRGVISALQSALMPIVKQMIGMDGTQAKEISSSTGSSSSASWTGWQDYYARLFSLGTGWLGWSPTDTLDATPAEILAAYEGRQEMIGTILEAVFGTANDHQAPAAQIYEPQLNPQGLDPVFDRAGLHMLKAKLGA